MDSQTDQIARNAAAIYIAGNAATIQQAIRLAVERNLHHEPTRLPKQSAVRKHIQAMTLATIGDVAYAERPLHYLHIAEELMTVLEEYEPMLAGRAAKLQFDGDVNLPIRIYCKRDVSEIVTILEQYKYPVSEFHYDTINTRFGRLNRILFVEDGTANVTLTLCRPSMKANADRNLFRDESVAILSLSQVRQRLEK